MVGTCNGRALPQDVQKGRPARPQRVKGRGYPLAYGEGLNDARTLCGKRRVSTRLGWAGEKSDLFSILLGRIGVDYLSIETVTVSNGCRRVSYESRIDFSHR